MYVIYPAEEVVSLTYSSHSVPRPRPRPTLDILTGAPPPAPSRAPPPPPPTPPRAASPPKTAPPEIAERAPASPTPSLDRTGKRAKATKLLKKLGRQEDPQFGKIVRTPAPDEFEFPAPLPTPAFSRKNIFDRDFDALFEVANSPQFGAHIRVNTPEPDRRSDVSAAHFSSPSTSSLSLLPPRPLSEPTPSPALSRTSSPLPPRQSSDEGSNSRQKKVSFFRKLSGRAREASTPRQGVSRMQQQQDSLEMVLKELTHPMHNEELKNQQNVTFKLVKTVSDFTSQLAKVYERHSSDLQILVANFRKRSSEMRKERAACPSSLFHTWEGLLTELESDVVSYNNAAQALDKDISSPLLDRTFHMKVQARKIFAHRDNCEAILGKADEQLKKSRHEYRNAFLLHSNNPTPANLSAYYDSHNNYVQQLTATNAMFDQYHKHTLPTVLQELEEVLGNVTAAVSEAICHQGEVMSDKCTHQLRRYESISVQARAVSSTADLAHLARTLLTAQPAPKPPRRPFLPPYPPEPDDPPMDIPADNIPPVLREEMLLDRMGALEARMTYDQLTQTAHDLEIQIKQLQDNLAHISRLQHRYLEAASYSEVNEIQEEISVKKYDYRAAQLHLASVRAQRDLFAAKAESAGAVDRKLSASSTGSMKNKWLKAFRSLKPASSTPPPPDKRNGATPRGLDSDAHNFQENTYKKITPCDICSQILRGHTRQGLRCRLCKMNVHVDCMSQVGKCQTKSKLLRRQKSTSEIEAHRVQDIGYEEESYEDGWLPGQRLTRISFKGSVEFDDDFDSYLAEEEVDQTYQVLKRASEIARPSGSGVVVRVVGPSSEEPPPSRAPARPTTGLAVVPQQIASSSGARTPDASSMRRRLFAGVKSITMWGSKSRRASPQNRSISLPERLMKSSKSAQMLRQSERASPFPAPHSPRRQRLNLRMKSLSLDSPECGDVRRRPTRDQHTAHGSRVLSPSSPVHSRRMLSSARGGGRMNSVELPDDHDKSHSSNSASPCPSPVKQMSKYQRLLPTNLYVVLYNFKSRQEDELDLKAGFKVTVIDNSDPNWWKGKCLGKIGYFPSKYCIKLQAGEKPLQVTHNLQVSDGEAGLMLLRDQIVIQVGDEMDGMVMIRSADNRQGVCPVKFLQEV